MKYNEHLIWAELEPDIPPSTEHLKAVQHFICSDCEQTISSVPKDNIYILSWVKE